MYLLVALSSGRHGSVQSGTVSAAVSLHGGAEAGEALADVAELPLVVVLALGGLVRRHLGKVLHGAVEQCAELTEYLHLSVPATGDQVSLTQAQLSYITSVHQETLDQVNLLSLLSFYYARC